MSSAKVSQDDPSLYLEVLEKLIDDTSLDDHTKSLIDAALSGPDALNKALEQGDADLSPPSRRQRPHPEAQPPQVFLKEISVRSFRGAGPRTTLPLDYRPGLTLVVGRNGTGKSTFADALETLLTGTTQRWTDIPGSAAGWRNLGSQELPEVGAELIARGIGLCKATRSWTDGDELKDGQMTLATEDSETEHHFDWAGACSTATPFLGYRQLGAVAEDPSGVFDALHSVLGLELFDAAEKRVDTAIKRLTDREKEVKGHKEEAERTLARSADQRAQELLSLVQQKQADLAALDARIVKLSSQQGGDDPELSKFSRVNLPSAGEWDEATVALDAALSKLRATQTVALQGNETVLDLLEKALPHLDSDPSACPLCRTPLDNKRVQDLRAQAETLRASTRAFREAQRVLATAAERAAALVNGLQPTPQALREQLTSELSAATISELSTRGKGSPEQLLLVLQDGAGLPLVLAEAQARCVAELEKRGTEFEKMIQPLRRWLDGARAVDRDKPLQKALKRAKDWLKSNGEGMRTERFAPLEQAALQNWGLLGADSSVLLRHVKLKGAKNRRKLDLEVEVDGVQAPGVAVLSQGEVNCMALSLFLPRASQQDGPFRFVLIDDPVQAMDQVKVDGLARVLSGAANDLQVVVFTHDTRLVDSVRRLQIDANIVEVRRKANSELVVRKSRSPVDQYLSDARSVAKSKDAGHELPARVVPGFCRMAVEAACLERVYQRRLPRGESYEDVAELLRKLRLFELLALALEDDEGLAENVPDYFKTRRAHKELGALFAMKQTHGSGPAAAGVNLEELVHWSEEICKRIAGAP